MSIGSVCTGYGGLDMAAAEVLGGELIFAADNDEGAAAILAHRYPSVKNLGDITAVDWADVEPVDVLTAGFPCQDVSAAGKRAGLRKGNRSGVWLEVVHAIAALRPGLVVIENVRGLLTARGDEPTDEHLRQEAARDAAVRLEQWLDNELNIAVAKGDADRVRRCRVRAARVMGARKRAVARCAWHERRLVRAIGTVLGDLAGLGYDARWAVVSAAEAGAPHRRERVFIVAWPADAHGERVGPDGRAAHGNAGVDRPGDAEPARGRGPVAADPGGGELQRRGISGVLGSAAAVESGEGDQRERAGDSAGDGDPAAEDADGAAGGERREPAPGQAAGGRPRADAGRPGGMRAAADAAGDGRDEVGAGPVGNGRGFAADYGHGPAADASSTGREACGELAERASEGHGQGSAPCAPGPAGIEWGAYEPAIRRWEAATGRRAPAPTEPGRTGQRLSPRFVEWMMGLPEGWVTGVPGLSRNAQLKALGNGVVPQQAVMALRALLGRVPRLAPGRAA